MSRLYSHPREYRKIFLGNYLCIGFVPGGTLPFLFRALNGIGIATTLTCGWVGSKGLFLPVEFLPAANRKLQLPLQLA